MRVYLTILLSLGKLPPLIPATPAPQQLGTWKTPGLAARHSAFPACTKEDEMLGPSGDPSWPGAEPCSDGSFQCCWLASTAVEGEGQSSPLRDELGRWSLLEVKRLA